MLGFLVMLPEGKNTARARYPLYVIFGGNIGLSETHYPLLLLQKP